MSEHQDARQLLDRAKHAAMAGDFTSADEFLRGAARIQEDELGPLHPDLANTLNNLAIVAEKTGRPGEAEPLYRRAAAIAAAALPSDHPMTVETRQNLEDFCRAHGLPIDTPAVVTPTGDTAQEIKAVTSEPPRETDRPPVVSRPTDTGIAAKPAAPQPVAPRRDPGPPAPIASQPLAPAPTSDRASQALGWFATGVVILVGVALIVLRPWSSRDASAPPTTPEPAAARPAEPVSPPIATPPAGSAPIGEAAPKAAPRRDDRKITATTQPAAGAITLATAQLCRNFSSSGSNWRCAEVGSSVAPGPLVLYTRVASPRDTAVVHRWYRGNTLRQSVKLATRANATEGYRTFSRQTVDHGDWRVEVRSVDGKLLHEERFVVR